MHRDLTCGPIRLVTASAPSGNNIMGNLKGGQRVTACVNEFLHTRVLIGGRIFRTTRKIDVLRTRLRQCLCGAGGLALVHRVR
jgi:hypothetical protein